MVEIFVLRGNPLFPCKSRKREDEDCGFQKWQQYQWTTGGAPTLLSNTVYSSAYHRLLSQHLTLLLQRLPPPRTLGIQIRPLAQTHCSLARSGTQSEVVIRRGMVHAAIIPDGEIVGVLPSEAELQIVVLCD